MPTKIASVSINTKKKNNKNNNQIHKNARIKDTYTDVKIIVLNIIFGLYSYTWL